ncbi:MAG: single-stranded-DNA-specific exonuclease RecJ [Selenomonadaceae bacterium]|nr:single-stranded-DNA-specific exonuclease RecJ [Selenomonadaceae bacterium]
MINRERSIWEFAADGSDCMEPIKELARAAGISEFLAGLLYRRGITEAEAAEKFLNPLEKQELYSPRLLSDSMAAAERIAVAIERGEKVCIYGDYDVDGVTSVTILVRTLRRLGGKEENITWYVPNRFREGYGLNEAALRKIAAEGTRLVVTVDCGIKSMELIASMSAELGMEFVVTDHHLPDKDESGTELIPKAIAVVNPHCHHGGAAYPWEEICGAEVAFKLAELLTEMMAPLPDGTPYEIDMELAALGACADVMPLLDENRRIVKRGLELLGQTEIKGLRAILEAARIKKIQPQNSTGEDVFSEGQAVWEVTTEDVGFRLAPLINAAGRVADAGTVVELLLETDSFALARLAGKLQDYNLERQNLTKQLTAQAEAELEQEESLGAVPAAQRDVIVVAGEDWAEGIIGLAAARLMEKYNRPAVVFSITEDKTTGVRWAKGSARSIDGFHIHDALSSPEVSAHISRFGGHAKAAGVSVEADRLGDFTAALTEYAGRVLTDRDKQKKIKAECRLQPSEISPGILEDLKKLEPTGEGNRKPVFGIFEARAERTATMGQEGVHLQFWLPGRTRVVYWRGGEQLDLINSSAVDFLFTVNDNEWQGQHRPECVITELRSSSSAFSPQRLRNVFKLTRQAVQAAGAGEFAVDESLVRSTGVCSEELQLILEVFRELDFISGSEGLYSFVENPAKRSLEESKTYRILTNR